MAKFVVAGVWGVLLALLIYLLGLLVGTLVGLPPTTNQVVVQGSLTIAGTAVLTILLITPVAFFAGIGRGYLAPMGAAIFLVVLAQIVAAAGWGEFFPWAIPALHAGMAGPRDAHMGISSYILVLATSLLGLLATLLWWEQADQAD